MKYNRHSIERKVEILVDITILTVSFPLDVETSSEIQALVRNNEELERMNYDQVLNLPVITDPLLKGFAVLAYAGDEVIGAIIAVDMIGIHSYEWSALVHHDFRRQGLGHALIQELQRNFEIRGCESELALTLKESQSGESFLLNKGYEWNFSEATLKAEKRVATSRSEVDIVPFTSERQDVMRILMSAFGDTEDEVQTMIDFNVSNPTRHVFVAKKQGKVVGTVTAVEEGNKLWITALATDPLHQRQGIGSSLLAFVQDEGSRRGSEAVMLDVEIDNDKALSVYEKAGFMPTLQVDYYVKTPTAN